jgi:hypothetical protein
VIVHRRARRGNEININVGQRTRVVHRRVYKRPPAHTTVVTKVITPRSRDRR